MNARVKLQNLFRIVGEFFEDVWFDRSRNVRTSGNVSLRAAGIPREIFQDSEIYQPARPRHIRQALGQLPIQSVSDFSYIDLGSGKGRSLFVASELPFRQIIGVELSHRLHNQACDNIRRFRFWGRGCRSIVALHENAKDFEFPAGNLVLYLFNPFGAATIRKVLNHLELAMREQPRHVIIVLLWPRCEDQVAAIQGMHLTHATREFQIFAAQPVKTLHAELAEPALHAN